MIRSPQLFRFCAAMFLAASISPAADLEKAKQLHAEKKYQEAERELKAVLQEEPENTTAQFQLGLTLLELERYKEAEQWFRAAATTASVEARVGLARAYLGQDRLDDSLAMLKDAQEIKADHADVYHYRGMALLKQKKYAAAAEALEKALELNPRNAYSHYYAGMAYSRMNKPDKMVEHFEKFLSLSPDAPEAKKVQSLLRSL